MTDVLNLCHVKLIHRCWILAGSPLKRARREALAKALAEEVAGGAIVAPGDILTDHRPDASYAVVPLASFALSDEDWEGEPGRVALKSIQRKLFIDMTEGQMGVEKALAKYGVPCWVLFSQFSNDSTLEDWYRGTKKAGALLALERVNDELRKAEQAASPRRADGSIDPLWNRDVANLKQAAAKMAIEAAKWSGETLLPDLYSRKSQVKTDARVEIVITRKSKKRDEGVVVVDVEED